MLTDTIIEEALTEQIAGQPQPSSEPRFERIEFQVPIGFTARLDKVRRRRGLSRSAYVRQAILFLMEEDAKE
jgi:Ribbon-helix-helix protein, copG family